MPSKIPPYLKSLNYFETRWHKTYNELVEERDRLDPEHPHKALLRQIIKWMEGEEQYGRLNDFMDRIEGKETTK